MTLSSSEVDKGHKHCSAIDPHYTQQHAAAPAGNAAQSDEASPAVQRRFQGTTKALSVGKCGGADEELSTALSYQRRCNEGLISASAKWLQGRQLIMLGDSLMLQQWLSTLAMMATFMNNLMCPSLHNIYSRGYNGIPPFYCAATSDWASGKQGVRFCYAHRHPWHHNVAKTLQMISKHYTSSDVILMNSGLWHRESLEITNQTVTEVLSFASRGRGLPALFWRETSPQHFAMPYEKKNCLDYPTCSQRSENADCASNTLNGLKSDPTGTNNCALPVEEHCTPCTASDWKGCINSMQHNEVARSILLGSSIKVVPIWHRSVSDWSSHLGLIYNRENQTRLDCSHYCLPSPTVNSWTLALFAELTRGSVHRMC